jgi:hypothetical protein
MMAPPDMLLFRTRRFCVIGIGRGSEDRQRNLEALTVEKEKKDTPSAPSPNRQDNNKKLHVFLDINEPYTRQMILKAFQDRAPYFNITLGPGFGNDEVAMPSSCHFQWAEYERIDWTSVLAGRHGASSYCVRKGLSRKAQLAYYTSRYIGKQQSINNKNGSNKTHKNDVDILRKAMPHTLILDTWPVWDDASTNRHHGDNKKDSSTFQGQRQELANMLIHGTNHGSSPHEIRQRLEQCLAQAKRVMRNADRAYARGTLVTPPVWILKPSTVNKGAGIQIIHLYEQLLDICWEESDIREWYV